MSSSDFPHTFDRLQDFYGIVGHGVKSVQIPAGKPHRGNVRPPIHEQYARWGFTAAEFIVGDLLMRGHSTRQIAAMLGKGEGTIRNQTISIYRKAGMTGRSDLAAFFLNEFIGEDDG